MDEQLRTPETGRQRIWFWICLAVTVAVVLVVGLFLAVPLQPLGDEQSTLWSWEDTTVNWGVYVIEDGQKRELDHEEGGEITGFDHPGQTYYMSCVLPGADNPYLNPLLEINSLGNFAMFLDDDLLYATAPVASNSLADIEIGPPLSVERTVAPRVSLPSDYAGRRLTIVQVQMQETADREYTEAFVGPIILYGGGRYRSNLTSDIVRTAYPMAALAVVGVLLLVAFVVEAWLRQPDVATAVLSGFVLLWMAGLALENANLSPYYPQQRNWSPVFYYVGLTCLFLFMAAHLVRGRKLLFAAACVPGAAAVLGAVVPALHWDVGSDICVYTSFAVLVLSLVLAFRSARHGSAFFRLFTRLFMAACVVLAIFICIQGALGTEWYHSLLVQASLFPYALTYFLYLARALLIGVCVACALADFMRRTVRATKDAALMSQRQMAAEKSIEQFKRHARETAMLQHDMRRHLGTIGLFLQAGDTGKAQEYLKEINVQVDALPSVAHTGNTAMDLLLGAKLGEASESGLRTSVLAEGLPDGFPLTEAETASLVLNTLDNAMRAAESTAEKRIALQVYSRNGFLFYRCENSAPDGEAGERKKEGTRKGEGRHGYGLRIIQRIADRHGGVVETKRDQGSFAITILIPWEDPLRPA